MQMRIRMRTKATKMMRIHNTGLQYSYNEHIITEGVKSRDKWTIPIAIAERDHYFFPEKDAVYQYMHF